MLRKTFQILKNNPSIIIFQMVYIAVTFLSTFLIYSVKQREISSNIDYVLYYGKFLIAAVLGLILGAVFLSGFGNALLEAVTSGKSRFKTFLVGIKKYFIKTMFSELVLYITYVVFSSILLPKISQIIIDIFVPYGEVRIVLYYALIYILNVFIMPFTALFFPAIYIDNCDIITGLITGMKLATQNYRKLVWIFLAMYIPVIINIIFIKDSVLYVFAPLPIEYILDPIEVMSGKVFSVSIIIMYLLEAAIFLVSIPLFFVIYKDSSSKRLLY